ncbi:MULTISPECIES: phenylglyoxylate dehydrogenase [unclassified Sedimentibacter]|uniref:phenylglyoxylate dehydrogenase n=1 Tax=unclassified Sedimentibacter TaxID=2649220 RepID=UPI0027E05ED9|nr:phenylglyoxylate dehydrogenase [Sedimentibacter sp. MB35-C1]WMJ76550.1 phenylglyoxylate dehydrogenase [Sedimentibacter sp. MB35-C1]
MKNIKVLDGNHAAAIGAILSKPDVVAAYPITPQTPLVQHFSQYVADGVMDSTIVEPESEHSAMSVLTGASLAGARTFTATSSQGLALMYEPYFRASTMRLPIVMNIVNREMISPQSVWGGPQDSLTVRDAGWIQIYVEDNQEILDMTIQAFKIAENNDVLLPINICYDGFYLSHMTEGVEVPLQEEVNAFLPPYKPTHVKLDPETPMAVDPLTPGNYLQYYRELHMAAMDNAKRVIKEVNDEFAKKFGRDYFGLVEPYRMEDAEYVLVTLGSLTGSARIAVDLAREKGVKCGLIKIRSLRPFPVDEVNEFLKNAKAIGVIDRNVSFGWHTGIVYQEIKSAISSLDPIPTVPFIGGLGGEDLTTNLMVEALDSVIKAGENKQLENRAHWLINRKGR